MPRPAHNLLDGDPILGQTKNGSVVVLAPQISLILDPFSSREQTGVDRGRANCGTNLAHRFAHRVEEGTACILH